MAYSQALVLAGGIAHVPILITALKFLDGKTLKLHKSRAAADAKAKEIETAKKAAAAAGKAAEEKAAKAKAAAAAAAAAPSEPESN